MPIFAFRPRSKPLAPQYEDGNETVLAVLPLLSDISMAVAGAEAPETALRSALIATCTFTGWPLGHIYARSDDGQDIASSGIWHLDPQLDCGAVETFRANTAARHFAPGQGIIGKVAAELQPISIADVAGEPGFLRAAAAAQAGLRGYFAFPLITDSGCVAIMEFMSERPAALTPALKGLMLFIGEQIGRIIERDRHHRVLSGMRDRFAASVKGIAETVAATASDILGSADMLNQTIGAAAQRGDAIEAASATLSGDVGAVMAAVARLQDSARVIDTRIRRTAEMAREMEVRAEETDTRMAQLLDSAGRIGNSVSLIRTIANQTNMLALNANIEAARAGTAGAGFAVVAVEVKALSQQTERATQEISTHVAEVQALCRSSADAATTVSAIIGGMRGMADDIAAAVDGQGHAIQDIADLAVTAGTTGERTRTDARAAQDALGRSGAASGQLRQAADALGTQGQELTRGVAAFLSDLEQVV